MGRNWRLAACVGCTGLAALLSSGTGAAQSWRYRGMDQNRDGVITRAEWRGNDQSFRRHDRNNDGILSGDELNTLADEGGVQDFRMLDDDGNGHVTMQEWRRAFSELDTNRDGSLTRDEIAFGNTPPAPAVTRTFQLGRDRGVTDGRQAGREDAARRNWDLEGQRELEQADAGYRSDFGPRDQYQAGYREGFRQGYTEGFGPRR